MSVRRSFSAVVVGENSLVVACAERLVERGHQVVGVVSPDRRIRGWAEDRGVATGECAADVGELLAWGTVDHVFSITNFWMLPEEVLGRCRGLAINFHDALLPLDAGMHASTWAVWNGAERHGVTWHAMTAEADAGDILEQHEFAVDDRETSYSLNVKCWEAGLELFGTLVDALAEDRVVRTPQDVARRTYHPLRARPAGGLVVTWDETAAQLDAAVRATVFGAHENPFGTVKLAVGDQLLVVEGLEPCAEASTEPPGTVVACDERGLRVATLTDDVILSARCEVEVGERLPHLSPEDVAGLTEAYAGALRHEAGWVERLQSVEPLDVPHRASGSEAGTGITEIRVELPSSPALVGQAGRAVAAATLAFLARAAGADGVDVGVVDRRDRSTVQRALLAPVVPLRLPPVAGTFAGYHDVLSRRLDVLCERGPFVRDVTARYPQLREALVDLPVVVDLVGELGAALPPMPAPALLVQITHAGTACRWLVDEAVLARRDAEVLRDNLVAFLRGLHPGQSLADGPLASPAEQRILATWTDTVADYPQALCVHQLVAEHAARRPEAPAVVFAGETVTYGVLDERATALAHHLGRQGVGPGDLVGVQLERSPDLVVALLAVMKSGAAYVPLDPIYPPARIAAMVDDAQVALLVTQSTLDEVAEADEAPRERYDRATPDDLAYVIYTSGSTGRPKGVRIGHRALANFLWAMAREPGFDPQDSLLAVTTVCFDIAGLELYLPLMVGGSVEIAPAEVASDGVALREHIERARPTVVQATPATWKMLVAAGWPGDPSLSALCGGEALAPELTAVLLPRVGELWNLYGPTETTIWSAVSRVVADRPITLGRPIANTTFRVLDQQRRPVPRGVPGELYIGGHGVADGYLHRPELTGERFVADPADPDGGRLYRTGDVVRWRTDGDLEYLGRSDHQVKVRGFRIELGEVESALLTSPAVAEAVVVARDDDRGDQRLVGYVVGADPDPTAGANVDRAALRAHVATTLPDYMVPAAIVALPALPLTPNGKVDRRALPAPDLGVLAGGRAPRTPLERSLCSVFGDVLGIDGFGIDDSFFELGGDSLVVTRLLGHARDAGLHLGARDVFQHPTPAALAAHLDATATGQGPEPARPDLPAEVSLPADIVPAPLVPTDPTPGGDVTLTGATGFLGAFLLREIARQAGGATVRCLVRAADDEKARVRLRANLERYGLWEELCDLDVAIDVVVGDLAAPLLGLGATGFDRLAASTAVVYHAGASVNWLHRYADIKAVNVSGTETMLRLATRDRTVPVHYVSSMGVFAQRPRDATRHAVGAPIGPPEALVTGYQQSKWVTEMNLRLARQRGLPVSIYRVARVSGDSATGACQHDDFLWRFLKGCLQVGGVPAGTDLVFDLVPVDFVATALVWLSRHPANIDGTFHLSNPVLTRLSTVVEHLRSAGYELPPIDREKWSDLVRAEPGNAAHPLLDIVRTTVWDPDRVEVPLDPTETHGALAASGIACPPVDDALLATYTSYFVGGGYFPSP